MEKRRATWSEVDKQPHEKTEKKVEPDEFDDGYKPSEYEE